MRQYTITLLLILFLTLGNTPEAYSAIKGGVKYSVPVYYENLAEEELNQKAEEYFCSAIVLERGTLNETMSNALVIYSILQNVNPDNTNYPTKLGILYDKLGKDRLAKGEFSRAIGIDTSEWEPYFYMGEFYYERALYRNALKYYKKALERTAQPAYELLFKIGDVYEKLGDTKNALKYMTGASNINPNTKLDSTIERLKERDITNKAFYSN